MSQTNTNTGGGNTNCNQNATRGRRGQVGSGGRGRGSCTSGCRNSSIVKYSFEGKMKVSCLSKLTITESSNRAIQFKKIVDALPVYCADKGYWYIDNIIPKNTKLLYIFFLTAVSSCNTMVNYVSYRDWNCLLNSLSRSRVLLQLNLGRLEFLLLVWCY